MEIRTYGVEGYVDLQCVIPVGKARAVVHFTGGTMTAYGVTPAEYSTGDPVRQKIIEGSLLFRQGRIILLRKSGTPEPAKPRAAKRKEATLGESSGGSSGADADTTGATGPRGTVTNPGAPEGPSDEPLDGPSDEPSGADAMISVRTADVDVDVEPEEVVVSCLPDAQNFLRDHYGIPTSKSRSKEKAQAFARENGVVFVGLD